MHSPMLKEHCADVVPKGGMILERLLIHTQMDSNNLQKYFYSSLKLDYLEHMQ